MKLYKERSWQLRTTGIDGNVILFGVNIFNYQWISTGETIMLDNRTVNIYTVEIDKIMRKFAAVEVSNCVWAFYTYR